ncbi:MULTISPECIES: 3-hydroxyacyl-ACP dehydratase FabZ [Dictyoglomus]|uniref:3-hydroxyacyl-[acyl-carrier-protein] dehydratase FabZ n=1 Tax=Dictyoglomus turgidum (strain DSM 6724 / Z-1310) TaxID=515635 RepID=B8E019_DICTD|nr:MULTISPECIES: 3-hydroxyacyl-ACP dehydratase FabZ [Dictyoglomus]ACK42102.1 beta-hydroxyacyl-(acyl-carrier-protein) dehydratase FabZ [Dictyoglomus turgidum DSM 6724]HBU32333.1 3-hydroxyacyl-[acyl-carrier-protein] dehydratase FabZ [Dictyoglomus sp.]
MREIDILSILPHRFPFLFVDKVIEYKEGESLKAVKNVSYNDYFFIGHFPQRPVMPGVLMVEALAQASGLLLYLTYGEGKDPNSFMAYLAGINNFKFRRNVFPGDVLILEVKIKQTLRNIYKLDTKAFVDDKLVAEGEITIALGG